MNTEKAVDLLDNLIGMVDDNQGNDYDAALHMAMNVLKAQADGDTISRKAAIDALDNLDYMPGEWSVRGLSLCKDAIKALPPAQPEVLACGEGELIAHPEIIRCKDCKHWKDSDGVYRRGIGAESKCPVNIRAVYEGNFYCADAERRTDG